jgi:hypothetical protein
VVRTKGTPDVREGIAAYARDGTAGREVIRIERAIIYCSKARRHGYGVTRLPSRFCESCSVGLAWRGSGELLEE